MVRAGSSDCAGGRAGGPAVAQVHGPGRDLPTVLGAGARLLSGRLGAPPARGAGRTPLQGGLHRACCVVVSRLSGPDVAFLQWDFSCQDSLCEAGGRGGGGVKNKPAGSLSGS